MGLLVANCPRCDAQSMTFDVRGDLQVETNYGWQRVYELFCECRGCHCSTVFVAAQTEPDNGGSPLAVTTPTQYGGALTGVVRVDSFICLKDLATAAPPEHCPESVAAAFREGATCLVVGCFNAAGAIFRLCVDLATRPIVEKIDEETLNAKTRRDLGLRLPWLFDHGKLPEGLRELSVCIKDDGNDAAHAGTLGKVDAEDLLDFTTSLLEQIYTEPKRVEIAKQRRVQRRAKPER